MNARSFHHAPLLGAILLALGPMAVAQTAPDAGSPATHVENADRFKGVGKVVLASCGVYVLREFDAGSSSQGGSTRGSIAMTSVNLKVVGLEPARLQALSEQLCAQAAESVRARGIAVVELPAEGGSPAVAAWRGAGEPAPLQFDAERGVLARVSPDKPLIAQQGFGEIADVTSTAETAGNIALAAFSILSAASGHGRAVINNSRKQELRADPDQFDAVAKAQATVALEALAARLAAP